MGYGNNFGIPHTRNGEGLPLITNWVPYNVNAANLFVGFGTVTAVVGQWRKVGDSMEIRLKWTAGTSTNVTAKVPLPEQFWTAGTDKIPSLMVVGMGGNTSIGDPNPIPLAIPNVQYLELGAAYDSIFATLAAARGADFTASVTFSIQATVPIQGWEIR